MALIESASEITRDKVIERLQTTLPLMEVALPPRRSPEEIVEFIGEARKKAAGRVLSVTGWETALPTDRPLAGSLGIINFSRERMLEGEPRQIWWMNPSFKNAFMHYARDTFSWFMLRLRLTELPEPAIEHSRPEPVRPSTGEEERIRKDAEFAIRHAVAAIRRGDVESAIDSVVPPLWDLWTIDHNADILKHADSLDAAIAASTGYPSVADWIRERSRHASPDGISRHVAFLRILGMARYESGAVDDGKLLVEESLGLARRRTEAEISADSLRDLSVSLNKVGSVRRDAGQLAEAIAAYEESLQIGRDILKDYGRSLQALRDLSVSLDNVGRVRLDAGQLAEAITAYEESLQIRRDILKDYGRSLQALRDLSVSLNNVGNVRRDAGQLAEAIAAYEESLQIRRDILKDYGRSLQALRDLSVSLNNVGDVRRDAGQLAEAIAAYEESLQIGRDILKDYGRSLQALRDLAVSLWRVGAVSEKPEDVQPLANELKDIYDRLCEEYPQVESLKEERNGLLASDWFRRAMANS